MSRRRLPVLRSAGIPSRLVRTRPGCLRRAQDALRRVREGRDGDDHSEVGGPPRWGRYRIDLVVVGFTIGPLVLSQNVLTLVEIANRGLYCSLLDLNRD